MPFIVTFTCVVCEPTPINGCPFAQKSGHPCLIRLNVIADATSTHLCKMQFCLPLLMGPLSGHNIQTDSS